MCFFFSKVEIPPLSPLPLSLSPPQGRNDVRDAASDVSDLRTPARKQVVKKKNKNFNLEAENKVREKTGEIASILFFPPPPFPLLPRLPASRVGTFHVVICTVKHRLMTGSVVYVTNLTPGCSDNRNSNPPRVHLAPPHTRGKLTQAPPREIQNAQRPTSAAPI
jgi:hypothetical protein